MANEQIETCPEKFRYPGFHPVRSTPGYQTMQMGLADQVVFGEHNAGYFSSGAALGAGDNVTSANFLGVIEAAVGSATASANADTKGKFITPMDCQNMMFWAPVATGTPAAADIGTIAQFDTAGKDVTVDSGAAHFGFKILAVDTTTHNSIYYVKGTFSVVGA